MDVTRGLIEAIDASQDSPAVPKNKISSSTRAGSGRGWRRTVPTSNFSLTHRDRCFGARAVPFVCVCWLWRRAFHSIPFVTQEQRTPTLHHNLALILALSFVPAVSTRACSAGGLRASQGEDDEIWRRVNELEAEHGKEAEEKAMARLRRLKDL